MAKGYIVACYRSIKDPAKLAEYAKVAAPAMQAAGGRFLARGPAVKAYEAGIAQRTVLIEFDSPRQAMAAFESAPYQAAVKLLEGTVERDIRVLEGV
jgi:uncharacterized protein (DUF1330 family)